MSDPRELLERYAGEKAYPHMPYVVPERIHHAPKAFVALRKVLELHRTADGGDLWCVECGEDTPCPTVAAISEALGGDPHGQ